MKNSTIKYDKRITENYTVEDYTSKDFRKIYNMPETKSTDWVEYITLNDGQTIEQVSQILYDNPDYWDILMLINGRDPLFDMPYNFDVLSNLAEAQISKYALEYSGVYKQETFNQLAVEKLAQLENRNEELRTLKVVKPSKINDFIKLLRTVEFKGF